MYTKESLEKLKEEKIHEWCKGVFINCPKDMTEAHKAEIKHMMDVRIRDQTYFRVIYKSDCGCDVFKTYIIDRFPMSPVILSRCPECKKHCHMEISNPIIFYDPLNDVEIPIEKFIDDYKIMDTPQKPYIEAYQIAYLFHSLEEACKDD